MRRRSFLALPLAFGGLSAGCAVTGTSAHDTLDAELAAIVEDRDRPLASLSVLAMRAGEVVHHRQFGRRFIDPDSRAGDKPADARTMYRIASISKLVTALGVMKAVEEGKVSLDADVSQWMGFPLRNPHFPDSAITLRRLLSHTSSMRDDGGYYWDKAHRLEEALKPGGRLHGEGAMWAKNAPPGAYFQYCNLAWGVIGQVLERATGERFDRFMKRAILDPLGMRGGFNAAELPASDLADVAVLYRKGREVDDRMAWNPSGPWVAQVDDYSREAPAPRADANYEVGSNGTLFGPQGACRASAAELGRILKMLFDGGRFEGRVILKRESVDAMLARAWRYDGTNGASTFGDHADFFLAWGLGNQQFIDVGGPRRGDRLVEGGGFTAVGHLGEAWGLTSAAVLDPRTGNGLVFMVGGPGFDPAGDPGRYSSHYGYEERIMTALWRRAIAPA
jgi:CubicO group peptidase (beta-lactamase class C family)